MIRGDQHSQTFYFFLFFPGEAQINPQHTLFHSGRRTDLRELLRRFRPTQPQLALQVNIQIQSTSKALYFQTLIQRLWMLVASSKLFVNKLY